MGLEMRRRKIEKSDIDSFSENKWNKNQSTQPTKSDIESLRDLLDWSEEHIFSEQEAGKATINVPLQEKESMEEKTERTEAELASRSTEMLAENSALFDR